MYKVEFNLIDADNNNRMIKEKCLLLRKYKNNQKTKLQNIILL